MPCYHPIPAWKGRDGVVFSEHKSNDGIRIDLPCGRCIGCRLERSRQWATRIIHEAKSNDFNSFVTLTYSAEHLPRRGSLDYSDFQRFMKRTRKHYGQKIRYYVCGEYGEQLERPHFHACLFGIDFSHDRVLWSNRGFRLYRSPTLEKLWPFGYSTIGELNFETAAYTARYVMKKVTGDMAKSHYERIDPDTGEIYQLTPEFNKMSLKPGIGSKFIESYMGDVYPHDYLIVNGVKTKPPRYYDKKFEAHDPDAFDNLKADRQFNASIHAADNTYERLAVKEAVTTAKITQLKRNKI